MFISVSLIRFSDVKPRLCILETNTLVTGKLDYFIDARLHIEAHFILSLNFNFKKNESEVFG